MKQNVRLNNVIFPIWFIWFLPPMVFIMLVGNFVLDSLILLLGLWLLKAKDRVLLSKKEIYKKSILKIWLLGFLADVIAVSPLYLFFFFNPFNLSIPTEIQTAVAIHPTANLWAFLIVGTCVLLAGILIVLFNYRITFKKVITDKYLRFELALLLGLLTMPYGFLVPIHLF